jgi:hypothetical protein
MGPLQCVPLWSLNRPARFKLLQQSVLTIDVEVAAHAWRTGVRLSSSDTDGVVTLRNDPIAFLCDHAEVARAQAEVNLLTRSWFQVNALEPTKSNPQSSLDCREIEIALEPLYPFGYGLWASADCCMEPAKSIPVHATTRTGMSVTRLFTRSSRVD